MKILLSGGGTIGSVSPLIAIFEAIKTKQPQAEFLWLATRGGPEQKLLANYQIPAKSIFAGKFRRYFSLKNLSDPFLVALGFFQSLIIILKFKPDIILSAGGFVSVPVIWAGWLLRRPSLIHQQDVKPGLANKLMAPFAKIITVTFEKTLAAFPPQKTVLTGNPVRPDILEGNREEGYKFFQLRPELPTVLIIGGGTGALNLNNLVLETLTDLVQFCQVIHLTGGKIDKEAKHSSYRSYDFLTDQPHNAYAVSHLLTTRAGLSVLTELANLAKPAIIIPIPRTHQEQNAIEFSKNNAAIVVEEKNITPRGFVQAIKEVLADKVQLNNLSRNIAKVMPNQATQKIVKMIL